MAEAVPAAGGGTRYTESRRVTLVSLAVNLVLAAVKIVTGWLAASHALVADGVHSLSDLLTDVVVIVAAREASRRPDARHPYGHGRFETAVTLGLGLVLVVTGIGIAYDSAIRMQHLDRLAVPGVAALGVALVAIVAKEALYHYTMRTARRINSKLLRANAWHHRSDSISTVVVLGGIVGSQLGFPWLDPLAAIAVAVMIARVGWDLGWGAMTELVDTSLERGEVEDIRRVISRVDGVRDLHMLRTRHVGSDAHVDVHVIVAPRISVSEGHRIAETIRERVVAEVDAVSEVLVHVDSEDDAGAALGRRLPLREDLERDIRVALRDVPGAQDIRDLVLHYLRDRIRVEIHLPLDRAAADLSQARRIADNLRDIVVKLPHIEQVTVHFVH